MEPVKEKSFKVKSTIASHSPSNISETIRDRGVIGSKVPKSNDHVTDDVMWPRKVKSSLQYA